MTRKVLVAVLGDLARSPRMQYHCISLANNNYRVEVIANGKNADKCTEELESSTSIKKILMPESPNFGEYLPGFLAYLIKPIWQAVILICYLFTCSTPDIILMQNPPTLPTLPILSLYSKITGAKLVIDWHNYGFSILSLKMKLGHPFVRLSKLLEISFGRFAKAGFCVSNAMQEDLIVTHNQGYPIYVLYDRPPKQFAPLTLSERHQFFKQISNDLKEFRFKRDSNQTYDFPDDVELTRFTYKPIEGEVAEIPDRPALLISSTSWTEDEDFSLLLDALVAYEKERENRLLDEEKCSIPKLVCIITGKGPLKEYYQEEARKLKLKHVEILMPWLSAKDYPKIVGASDLGICLHCSSSGVDLPMKVVDMLGCCVPVLAYKYEAINELVIEDIYGRTFDDSNDLYKKILALLDRSKSDLDSLRKNIKKKFLQSRWEDNWNKEARPVLERTILS